MLGFLDTPSNFGMDLGLMDLGWIWDVFWEDVLSNIYSRYVTYGTYDTNDTFNGVMIQ